MMSDQVVVTPKLDEAQRRLVRRLAANLFQCPKHMHMISEYWMRGYTPLPTDTGAKAVISNDVGDWFASLLKRILQPPRDFVVSGQGGMALDIDAKSPRWMFTFNFVPPMKDFALALPLGHLKKAECDVLLTCFGCFFMDGEKLWLRGTNGGMHGLLWFDMFNYVDELSSRYCASAFVLLCMKRFMTMLCNGIPAALLHSDGYKYLMVALKALNDKHLCYLTNPGEVARVIEYRQRLRTEGINDIYTCLRITEEYLDDTLGQLAIIYREMMIDLEYYFTVEEISLLPWYKESNRAQRLRSDTWTKIQKLTPAEMQHLVERNEAKKQLKRKKDEMEKQALAAMVKKKKPIVVVRKKQKRE